MKTIYPAIFTQGKEVVYIEIPDLGIYTEGMDMSDALDMARDAIGLQCVSMEDHNDTIPAPSALTVIDPAKGEFAGQGESVVSLVDVDVKEYRRSIEEKTVRRNVALPSWIDYAAEKAKVNVSKILQEALIKELGLTRTHA